MLQISKKINKHEVFIIELLLEKIAIQLMTIKKVNL